MAKRTWTAPATAAAAGLWLAVLAAPAAAQTWQITLGTGGAGVNSNSLKHSPPNEITAPAATAVVSCQTAADCAKVGLQLEKNNTVVEVLGRSPAGSDSFQVPAAPVQGTAMDLAVTYQGTKIDSYPVIAAASGAPPAATPAASPTGVAGAQASMGSLAPQLADLLTTPCPSRTFTVAYDAAKNQGEIVVSPTGNVLARGLDTFDENDSLRVIVYGDARLLPLLKVERTSAFRDAQTVRIVGAGLTVPDALLAREGAGVCTTAEFLLADFAPGQAKVQLSALQGADFVPLGAFDFTVDPLYTGILSLGAAWTSLVDPEYKLASNGTQTVVALGQQGSQQLVYTLFYTPYVWGKRDLAKKIPLSQWYQHINPTIGIVPQKIDQNALVGLTVDLPAGILFTYGRHFGRISVLPASSGLAVGSPFTGTADQLPTTQSWKSDSFFAVTVDLRAMVQVLAAAATGKPGGS
jgi:hypothetical protein